LLHSSTVNANCAGTLKRHMEARLKLKPGQNGTKKLLARIAYDDIALHAKMKTLGALWRPHRNNLLFAKSLLLHVRLHLWRTPPQARTISGGHVTRSEVS